jgi:hypothetical protein
MKCSDWQLKLKSLYLRVNYYERGFLELGFELELKAVSPTLAYAPSLTSFWLLQDDVLGSIAVRNLAEFSPNETALQKNDLSPDSGRRVLT